MIKGYLNLFIRGSGAILGLLVALLVNKLNEIIYIELIGCIATIQLLSVILRLGLDQFFIKNSRDITVFDWFLSYYFLIVAISTFIVLLLLSFYFKGFYSVEVVFCILFGAIFLSFINILSSIFSGEGRFLLASFLNSLLPGVTTISCIILTWFFNLELISGLVIWSLGILIGCVLFYFTGEVSGYNKVKFEFKITAFSLVTIVNSIILNVPVIYLSNSNSQYFNEFFYSFKIVSCINLVQISFSMVMMKKIKCLELVEDEIKSFLRGYLKNISAFLFVFPLLLITTYFIVDLGLFVFIFILFFGFYFSLIAGPAGVIMAQNNLIFIFFKFQIMSILFCSFCFFTFVYYLEVEKAIAVSICISLYYFSVNFLSLRRLIKNEEAF